MRHIQLLLLLLSKHLQSSWVFHSNDSQSSDENLNQNTIDEHGRIWKRTSWLMINPTNEYWRPQWIAKLKRGSSFPAYLVTASNNKQTGLWPLTRSIQQRFLCLKIKFKLAYHQIHLNHQLALQTWTHFSNNHITMISLQLTFGRAPGMFEGAVVLETICILPMSILCNENWDPMILQVSAKKLVPKRICVKKLIPLSQAK